MSFICPKLGNYTALKIPVLPNQAQVQCAGSIQVNLYKTNQQQQMCKKYFQIPERKLCPCTPAGCSLCPVCVCARLVSVFCASATVLHSGHYFSTYQSQCETEGHRPHSVAIVSSDKRAAWLTAQPTTHIFFSLVLANALLSAQSPLLCGLVSDMCSRSLVHISRVGKGTWLTWVLPCHLCDIGWRVCLFSLTQLRNGYKVHLKEIKGTQWSVLSILKQMSWKWVHSENVGNTVGQTRKKA